MAQGYPSYRFGAIASDRTGNTNFSYRWVKFMSIPWITGISPDRGPTGSWVTIYGGNFGYHPLVYFNGVQATEYNTRNNFFIEAKVPSGDVTGDLWVINPMGYSSNTMYFLGNAWWIMTAWVNDFPACNGGESRDYNDDKALGFSSYLTSFYGSDFYHTDWPSQAGVLTHMFEEKDKGFGRWDAAWADEVEILYFASHGGYAEMTPTHWYGYTGADDPSPNLGCDWRSHNTEFGEIGEGHLKWLVLDACFSLDLQHDHLFYFWNEAFHGLHMIFGFDGLASTTWWTHDRGTSFAMNATFWDAPLSEAWLDAAYSFWEGNDPVAMAAGEDIPNCFWRLDNERILHPVPNINYPVYFCWTWRD